METRTKTQAHDETTMIISLWLAPVEQNVENKTGKLRQVNVTSVERRGYSTYR